MWELDHKEGWALKNWCFWIVERRGEDFWESLVCKEIKTINPIGNQPWISTGRTDAEAEGPILWPPDTKGLWKRPDVGKDWRQKEKGVAEDEILGSITNSMDMNVSKLWQMVKDREAWQGGVHGISESQTQLSDWTTMSWLTSSFEMGFLRDTPRGMVWGGRREEGSGWGTHVYLWRIHFDIWQN